MCISAQRHGSRHREKIILCRGYPRKPIHLSVPWHLCHTKAPYQYSVLDGKWVRGQTIQIPVSNGPHVHEERRKIQAFREWDIPTHKVLGKPWDRVRRIKIYGVGSTPKERVELSALGRLRKYNMFIGGTTLTATLINTGAHTCGMEYLRRANGPALCFKAQQYEH